MEDISTVLDTETLKITFSCKGLRFLLIQILILILIKYSNYIYVCVCVCVCVYKYILNSINKGT